MTVQTDAAAMVLGVGSSVGVPRPPLMPSPGVALLESAGPLVWVLAALLALLGLTGVLLSLRRWARHRHANRHRSPKTNNTSQSFGDGAEALLLWNFTGGGGRRGGEGGSSQSGEPGSDGDSGTGDGGAGSSDGGGGDGGGGGGGD